MPNELFKLDTLVHPNIADHSCGTGDLSRNLLDTKTCIVLDMGSEVFLWTGRDVSHATRDISSEFFAVIIVNRT